MPTSLLRSTSRLSLAIPLLAALGAAACDSPSDSDRGRVPAAVEIVSPNPQAGTAGAPLPVPVAVRVVDDRDRPVAGQAVSFVVTGGGGSISVPTVTTDAQGLAQVTWTLGTNAASPQTMEARVANGANTFTAAFTATISAAAPATVTAFPANDTVRVGSPGAPVTDSLAVVVRDAFGNPVPGVQVTWTADTGGGTLASPTTTDAQGVARTRWTLGPSTTEGHQLALGNVPGVGVVRFHGRVATAITKVPDTGDGATTTTGTVLLPRVQVTGPWGGVQDAEVRWQVTGGGGSVTPAESVTGSSGFTGTQWTLGAAGTQTLTATVGGLTTTFTATVLPQGNRTLVAQVPGRVLDVSATRVLWVDAAAPRTVRVRDRASGADAVVAAGVAADPTAGHLFTGGAAVVVPSGGTETVLEARGALPAVPVATITPGSASFDGDYAAWLSGSTVFRRDLAAGTTIQIATNATSAQDVGPNGDVVFTDAAGLHRWRNGTVDDVPVVPPGGQFPAGVTRAATDGVNVLYETYSMMGGNRAIWLAPNGTGTPVVLTGANQLDPPTWPNYGRIFDLNAGWTAYSDIEQRFIGGSGATPFLQVRRRSPAGVDVGVTPAQGFGFMVDAVGPDGAVVYRTADRRFLAPAGGGTLDLGPAAAGERVVFRDGIFYLISGGSVFRLGA